MTIEEFTLPDSWASPLINDDWTGIDDTEEQKIILQFLADHPSLCCMDVKEDSSFMKYHDVSEYGVLASNCSTFLFY